jgi:chitodextrinase
LTLVRCLSLALAFVLLPVASFGQNTPPPPAQEAPIGAFVGRYLDSAQKSNMQCPIRTYRAYDVKASSEDGLLYFAIGSAFVGQDPATFADRLASEPLATGYRGEKYLAFDHWYRREQCSFDIQESIRGFDWDDRGYKYITYAAEGLVILDEDFQEVNLIADEGGTDHLAFRNGSSYYLLAAIEHAFPGSARLLDVTDPTDVQFVRGVTSTGEMAKSRDGRIALLNNDDVLRIYTTDALVSGAAPSFTFTPPDSSFLVDITTDGTRFYAAVNGTGGSGTTLYVFTPSGETYTESVAASNLNAWELRYGAGYVVVLGGQGARFFAVGDDGLTAVGEDRLAWYNDENFDRRRLDAVQPVVAGDRTVLVVAALGVGDVFALDAHDPMTVSQSFAPASIDIGGTSQLTVTITNPRATPVLFGLAPTYTSGLVNAAAPAPSTTCSGATLIAAADGTSFALSNATLAANASCTVTVTVTSATPGNYINTIPAGAIDSLENTNAVDSTGVLVVLAPLGPPPSLSAYATSSTSVALIWDAVTGSPTYEIFRNDVFIGSTTSNSVLDSTVSANTSYIYKVRTAGTSGFSPADIATTVVFTDASLTGVAAKAVHITELRTAVNALRQLAGLGAETFTDNPLIAGSSIRAVHITELRSALDQARATLGQAPLTYGPLSTIRAADVLELRAGTQ